MYAGPHTVSVDISKVFVCDRKQFPTSGEKEVKIELQELQQMSVMPELHVPWEFQDVMIYDTFKNKIQPIYNV